MSKSLCFSLVWVFLGLVQVNASQIVAAVLLNEDGNPRCKIVQEEHDVFSSERFDDFVETNAQAEDALDELDALRECDSGDELYAIVVGETEIQEAGVANGLRSLVVRAAQLFMRRRPVNNLLTDSVSLPALRLPNRIELLDLRTFRLPKKIELRDLRTFRLPKKIELRDLRTFRLPKKIELLPPKTSTAPGPQ